MNINSSFLFRDSNDREEWHGGMQSNYFQSNKYMHVYLRSAHEVREIDHAVSSNSLLSYELLLQLFHAAIRLAYSTYRLQFFATHAESYTACLNQMHSSLHLAEESRQLLAHSFPLRSLPDLEVLELMNLWMRDIQVLQPGHSGVWPGFIALKKVVKQWRKQVSDGEITEGEYGKKCALVLPLLKGQRHLLSQRERGEEKRIEENLCRLWNRLDEFTIHFLSSPFSPYCRFNYAMLMIQVEQAVRMIKKIHPIRYMSWKASLILQSSRWGRESLLTYLKVIARDGLNPSQVEAYKSTIIPRLVALHEMSESQLQNCLNQVILESKGAVDAPHQEENKADFGQQQLLQLEESVKRCLQAAQNQCDMLVSNIQDNKEVSIEDTHTLYAYLVQAALYNRSLKKKKTYTYYSHEIEIMRMSGDIWHPSYLRKLKRLIQARKEMRKEEEMSAADTDASFQEIGHQHQEYKEHEATLILEHLIERIELILTTVGEKSKQEQAARALLYELIE